MSYKTIVAAITLTIFAVFSGFGRAQQNNSSPEGSAASGPAERGMMGGRMMSRMMMHHQEMSQLMNKMMQSMTAIKAETDPVKLKALLAEHSALMSQMHEKMRGEGTMMQNMAGRMKNCPMTDAGGKPESK